MSRIVFRPYRGDDREERIESDAAQAALGELLGGRLEIVDEIPKAATHVFGRTPENWWPRPASLAYPAVENQKLAYYEWPGFLENAGRPVFVHDLDGAGARVAEIHATGRDAFVKATRDKYYTGIVPAGTRLIRHLGDLAYSFMESPNCLMVQPRVRMSHEYRIFVVGGTAVTGAGNVTSHTPDDNVAQFNPLVSERPGDDRCRADDALVQGYLTFASKVVPRMPVSTFVLDVALIDGAVGIVEINPLHLGQVGLFGCDVRRLARAVLESCALLDAGVAAA